VALSKTQGQASKQASKYERTTDLLSYLLLRKTWLAGRQDMPSDGQWHKQRATERTNDKPKHEYRSVWG